ncbi:MAG: FAD-dependent oxidoreductase [Coriobacteriales bacterium]|nr:FAD-dependent oxidoreductase [Coriobacteriales bacterium]
MEQVTRKEFLAGSAISAGMLGLGLSATAAPVAAFADEAAVAEDNPRTAAARLNPQDYDYTTYTTDFATLFSPLQIGKLTIPNRMVKSAAGSNTLVNGMDSSVDYYSNIAKGGVGLLWVENFTSLLPDYKNFDKDDFDDYDMPRLVQAIHDAGAYCGYQFDTMSMQLFGGFGGAIGLGAPHPETMDKEEIVWFENQVIAGAKRCKDVGFDGFELNCAGNNLPRTFMSRSSNFRDDEYGPQSFENRCRIVTNIIKGIKAECGEDFVVQCLINAIEENDENIGDNALCSTVAETAEMAKILEAAGADSLHVRLGPLGNHLGQFLNDGYFDGCGIEGTTGFGTQFDFKRHFEGKLIANHDGCGMLFDVAAEIKSAVSIPVGAVTYMDPAHAPDYIEDGLAQGKVDFLMMNRPFQCDPEYVHKLQEGRRDEIRPCTRCLHCLATGGGTTPTMCRTNATYCRAYTDAMPEGFEPLPAASPKNVMVIGGGPAGLECARVAAQRGHSVTLYEKNAILGGTVNFARMVKGPHQNLETLLGYFAKQLELEGVTVVTDQEVDAAFVKEQNPDVVVLATGGIRPQLGFESTAGTNVIMPEDIFGAEIGENVVIVGANAQAFDIAQYLVARGKHITMVFPDGQEMLGKGQSGNTLIYCTPIFYALGSRVFPQAEITAVGDGEITVKAMSGIDEKIKCDTLIDASDVLGNHDMLAELDGFETYVVGDANDPWIKEEGSIAIAIGQGNLAARAM